MTFATLLLKRLPWILLLLALAWIFITTKGIQVIPERTEVNTSLVLEKVENLGKLELVKYNFQEITELKKISAEWDLKIFKLKNGPDSKAILISKGEAVACIDLTLVTSRDILEEGDTIYIQLPKADLCYFKLDLQKSKLYDLELGYLSETAKASFFDDLYKKAEIELEKTARNSDIFDQAEANAQIILKPLLEAITNKTVILRFPLDTELRTPN